MLIALLADIHGNREALTACLADAERAGADRYVFLGDLVGYGADPVWVIDLAAEMVEAGAVDILQADGPEVCGTRFGRQLGEGLFEFRLDGDPQAWIDEARARRGKSPSGGA